MLLMASTFLLLAVISSSIAAEACLASDFKYFLIKALLSFLSPSLKSLS